MQVFNNTFNDDKSIIGGNNAAVKRNSLCGYNVVTGHHADSDASTKAGRDSFGHFIANWVLDADKSEESQILSESVLVLPVNFSIEITVGKEQDSKSSFGISFDDVFLNRYLL